jgi:hypothetical protein
MGPKKIAHRLRVFAGGAIVLSAVSGAGAVLFAEEVVAFKWLRKDLNKDGVWSTQ